MLHVHFLKDLEGKPEILFRAAQTTAKLTRLKPVWNDRSISLSSRIELMRFLVTPVFLYACESWTPTAKTNTSQGNEVLPQDTTHLIQGHVTDEEIRAKIQQAIGPHEDPLNIVKRRKLKWYGYVSRSSVVAKTILQGTVKEGRRQGRQRKRWEDNIREWTGLEFGKSQRAVENRENGENLVQNHLWCPNDPRG